MTTLVLVLLLLMRPDSRIFENDYVSVHKNASPCAAAARKCGDRIIVALSDVQVKAKKMRRGDVSVFPAAESYAPLAGGDFLEVAIKPTHPPVKGPSVQIPPQKNSILYDGNKFFIFEEKLDPGHAGKARSRPKTRGRDQRNQLATVARRPPGIDQEPSRQRRPLQRTRGARSEKHRN